MRYPAIISICLIAACNNAPQQVDCQRFRNGEFSYKATDSERRWTMIRKDSIQKEIDHSTGKIGTFAVRWITPCEYELKYISADPADPDSVVAERKNVRLRTKITRTGEDFYEFTSSREDETYQLTGIMRLIKK
ncbi:hypothetical protein ACFOTA_24095 [Chitinophaga sp. GCM10012297]|uniref:Lipoprotein n=1 Tax=Chitinophaga chungangae TaxID=2821488 RepID=A0ABS3YKW6_9BACT|nr:hypothetical protein [Chitinophaga chungangae]MBO9155314.1 hypothetical protein [Chitinophaga chungangae]